MADLPEVFECIVDVPDTDPEAGERVELNRQGGIYGCSKASQTLRYKIMQKMSIFLFTHTCTGNSLLEGAMSISRGAEWHKIQLHSTFQ